MAETPAPASSAPTSSSAETDSQANPAPNPAAPAPLKKGSLVRVSKAAYLGSLEAQASDPVPPDYMLEGPGEILAVKGDYAQLRWNRPVPDSWLRLDQLVAAG